MEMLIDTHCHVLSSEYDNVDEILSKSLQKVDKIIINAYDLKSSKEAIQLANKYKNVYAAIGINYDSVDNYNKIIKNEIKELLSDKKVVAIGEIGLDYHLNKDNKDKQIKVFSDMLSLAQDNKLPVIVHSREATYDTYNILKQYNITGIIHCFSGSVETALNYTKLGYLIGIGGVITFKNAIKLQKVLELLDISDISLETDSPYLTPEPLRGTKNIPSNIIYVAKKVAQIKQMSIEEVISITGNSVAAKFDL